MEPQTEMARIDPHRMFLIDRENGHCGRRVGLGLIFDFARARVMLFLF